MPALSVLKGPFHLFVLVGQEAKQGPAEVAGPSSEWYLLGAESN